MAVCGARGSCIRLDAAVRPRLRYLSRELGLLGFVLHTERDECLERDTHFDHFLLLPLGVGSLYARGKQVQSRVILQIADAINLKI